jgi:hypothetical protein
MKDTIKDGGPAFPTTPENYFDMDPYGIGLSMRDYFAAKAMQGLVAASGDSTGNVDYNDDYLAKSAYAMADAMLKARE